MADETKVRVPQQARSRQRFDKILSAMAELLEEMDYVTINVALIAERAQTSVGSLYQFFENKDAVLQALTERYVEDFSAGIELILHPSLRALSVEDQLGQVLNWMNEFKGTHPGFPHVMENEWVSADVRASIIEMKRQLQGAIASLVRHNVPGIPPELADAAALLMMGLVSTMMNYAAASDDEQQRHLLIGETQRAGSAYLRALMERED
jgi:AcrR family transcriptional regulator